MKPDTQSSNQPLGGSSGDWRYRLLRFHLPLVLAIAVVLGMFMILPLFDANRYPHADLFSKAFPQQQGERESMDDIGEQVAPAEHGGDQAESRGHDGVGAGREGAHDRDDTAAVDHDEMTDDELMERRGGRSFIRQFTVATGYIATGLLTLTLLIGPANLLLRRRNPVSSYLRRDVGTWTVLTSPCGN